MTNLPTIKGAKSISQHLKFSDIDLGKSFLKSLYYTHIQKEKNSIFHFLKLQIEFSRAIVKLFSLKDGTSSKSNIKPTFTGNLQYEEIMKFYKINHIDLFVSVSETEGLPVSMMEAQSFGVPILSTDVGGCSEIVNNKTGMLLDKNFTSDEFKEKVNFLNQNRNYFNRDEVRLHWDEKFNIYKNYEVFYKQLVNEE